MIRKFLAAGAIVLALALTGCPGAPNGSVEFNLDLSALQNPAKGAPLTITAATATISRSGYADIVKQLTVSSGQATGRVSELAGGYWHINIVVFSDQTQIYTGEADVNVVPGIVVQATVLFDPVIVAPDTGGIDITVGMNPVPGFKVLDQVINKVMYSESRNELYLYDASKSTAVVYDGSTFNRIDDIIFPQAPLAICLGVAENEFIMGYSSGQIYTFNIETGAFEQAGDMLAKVNALIGINNDIVLALVANGNDEAYKTLNLANGQLIDTINSFYNFQDMVYNPATETAYTYTSGVSPSDLHRLKLNSLTGELIEEDDSRYHGDYSYGSPLAIIGGGSRIVTASGNMFTSAPVAANDLAYAGSIGQTYKAIAADEENSLLYVLNATSLPKLLVMDQTNYFVLSTVDLTGTPAYAINTPDHVAVIVTLGGRFYGKSFPKTALGLD